MRYDRDFGNSVIHDSVDCNRNQSLPAMPYKYLEEIGTADIAFEATGRDLPELFSDAADATMNVMIDNIDAIRAARDTPDRTLKRQARHVAVRSFAGADLSQRRRASAAAHPQTANRQRRMKSIF